jgi:peroxiredoxin
MKENNDLTSPNARILNGWKPVVLMGIVFAILAVILFSGRIWGPLVNGRAPALAPSVTPRVIFIALTPTSTSAAVTLTPAFSPHIGALAPNFSLQTVDGKLVELASSLGKGTLLYFFSTTCEYCHDQTAAIQALYRQYQSQGLQVLGIDDGSSGDTSKMTQDYIQQYGLTFPVLVDPHGSLWRQYLLDGYPDTIFLNSKGEIAYLVIGTMSRTEIEAQVKTLLK